jgi:hypothetical protein
VGGADDGVLPWPAAASTAGVAGDAGVAGVHAHHSPPGALSLGGEDAGELCPARVEDAAVQAALGGDVGSRLLDRAAGRGGHAAHPQGLKRQRVAGVDQRPGGLVVEVPPLLADLAPLPGELAADALVVPGARPSALLAALQVGDACLGGVEEAGVADDLPVAGGQEPRHSHVDADRPARRWQWLHLGFGDHDDVPAAVLPLQLQRLHPADHGAVLVDLDPPDRLEGRVRPSAVVGGFPLGAVSGDEQHLVEPLAGLEPGVADPSLLGFLALAPGPLHGLVGFPDAPEVGGEHIVQAAERLLLRGERVAALPVGVGGADLPELGRLVAVGDADLAHAPRVPPLLEGGVVEVAVVGQQPDGAPLLRARRVGAQLVSTLHGLPFSGRVVCSTVGWAR